MQLNMGVADRIIRIVLGVALIAFALYSSWAYAWIGWIGAVFVVTSVIGWCPVYTALGIGTRARGA